MPKHILVAMTNAVEGRDDEFNDWYTNQHLHDVVKAPGIVAAQRFVLDDEQRYNAPYPFKYLAIYEIESDSVQPVIDYIDKVAGTDAMPMSPAMSAEPRVRGAYFRPISERVTRKD
ncbi:MAG: hypothetical protein AB7I79_08320 [Rhizobiaceae bacterium]